jgi:hypothetical protein
MIIKQALYDGKFIHERFAYRYYKKQVSPYGNIVAFRAPMVVTDALIDLEDSMSQDFIFSDDAINFCWEIPNLDAFGAVAFQRLFNTLISNALSEFIKIQDTQYLLKVDDYFKMKGDDILVRLGEHKKASVSITYSKDNVSIGHTGINIKAGDKAPNFAFSTELTDDNAEEFMLNVINIFNATVADIFVATTKVIV